MITGTAPTAGAVLIVGAGGHGAVVADILRAAGHSIVGLLDDDPARRGAYVLGLPVLGTISAIAEVPHAAAIVAIGDNATRSRILALLAAGGETLVSAVHPRAIVSCDATLGRGVVVAAGAVVNPTATIADGAIVNTAATVDHHCAVGAYAHLAPGVHLGGGCVIGEGALLGVGTAVIPGRRIGAWAVVGAGAVVVRDIPDRAVAYGVPARPSAAPPSGAQS